MITLCWLIVGVRSAVSLEFAVHENSSRTLTAFLATGKVEMLDVERLDALLLRQPKRANTAVYLSSPGGDLYEGMRLGLFFKERRIKTIVEGGGLCASACAIAFLGGSDGGGRPWRSSSTDSRLGFHAFRGVSDGRIHSDDVQRIVADILRYGKRVDAPIELLIASFATPSADVFWVSHGDICSLGIKLWSNEERRFVCN
jgi:hypothetical protein